ncbi:MAG: hypothetical protein P4M11_03740 [Candidatus Pacebacteria bacterium]|nr:hypothetical protein [Candidatus Paceibacterota bacterium]
MGVNLCHDSAYAVVTESQGTLFLGLHVVYAICEVAFIWKTVRFFRREPLTFESWELLVFYVSMHLVFIRTCLYLLGGTVFCYPMWFYLFLDTYCYVFKRLGLFMLVYRMAKIVRQMNNLSRTLPELVILLACAGDVIAFSAVYWLHVALNVLFIYILSVELLLTWAFIFFARKISAMMNTQTPYAAYQNLQWKIFIIIMAIAFLMKVPQTLFNIMYPLGENSRVSAYFVFALYNVLYIIITEITPSMLMIWIFFNSTKEAGRRKSESCDLQRSESLFSVQCAS